MSEDHKDSALERRHKRVAAIVGAVVFGMVGMSYAAVPLYNMFCRATGYGGTPRIAESESATRGERIMTVWFDANISSDLPWTFEPDVPSVKLRTGETATIFYKVRNKSQRTTTGLASYNIAPEAAASFFNKIACFCFTQQTLGPGETMELPVVFYLDPELEKNELMNGVKSVTLSYTFFAAKTPVASADTKPKL